jgi:hypothetical protein
VLTLVTWMRFPILSAEVHFPSLFIIYSLVGSQYVQPTLKGWEALPHLTWGAISTEIVYNLLHRDFSPLCIYLIIWMAVSFLVLILTSLDLAAVALILWVWEFLLNFIDHWAFFYAFVLFSWFQRRVRDKNACISLYLSIYFLT